MRVNEKKRWWLIFSVIVVAFFKKLKNGEVAYLRNTVSSGDVTFEQLDTTEVSGDGQRSRAFVARASSLYNAIVDTRDSEVRDENSRNTLM